MSTPTPVIAAHLGDLRLLQYSSLILLKWWTPREDLVAEQPQLLEKECYEILSMALSSRLQVTQIAALRISTGCTQHTNICMTKHYTFHTRAPTLQLHASQYKQKTQYPLHKHTTYSTLQG